LAFEAKDAMAGKNQDIHETFVVNILATSPPEERTASVATSRAGDGGPCTAATAFPITEGGEGGPGPLEGTLAELTIPSQAEPQAPDGLGMWIGPYQLVEKIGEGSFGIVYLAEQVTPVRRRVALKLVRQGIDSWSLLERFKIEGQALALMDHPHIARVLDAGTTGGRPYFVMELLRGVPITAYCDEHGLDCRRRIELMIPVCKAIQHAHQKGVIHRDIKPSNVLVTTQDDVPVPKVIDFGVAKVVQGGLLGTLELTQCHQIIGTPAYMSPEQVGFDGIDVDTRSDIYSLGVLLYELLVGTPPFSRGQADYVRRDELWRLIREVEPPRPSARAASRGDAAEAARRRGMEPAALAGLLRGDLDWIVMKCLEKDRSRRYETANALALDLGRYLKSEPVLASPPSLPYRLKKFTRRHRGAVIVSTSVVIALAAGLITSLVLLGTYRQRSIDVLRLSDLKVVEELNDALPGLFGSDYRRRHDALASWSERARGILSRRAGHRETLERLRRRGTRLEAGAGAPAVGRGRGSGPVAPPRWRFADIPTQWQHDLLEKLTAELDDLDREGGKLRRVEAWLRRSPSGRAIDSRWLEVAQAIGPRQAAALRRRDGLVPLGRNEVSGLWEFVDLNSGLEPPRDPAGRLVVEPEMGVVFVLVPGGKFRMGSPPEEAGRKEGEDQHDVEISPFLLSKFEITQAQWERAMGHNPSRHRDPVRPVQGMSWFLAREFCRKAGYRLPSEAQWEYACRAGTSGPYSAAAPLEDLGWFGRNSDNMTQPAGRKRPNPFGLHDIHGNVLEWCQDVYDVGYYLRPEASGRDPVNDPPDGTLAAQLDRVLRGGPFNGQPHYCRCADRWAQPPGTEAKEHGLRPAAPIVD
jgi:formylglycine-generating enzyme required for sulfatase activity/serine/threonine protein kinase